MFARSCKLCLRITNKFPNHLEKRSLRNDTSKNVSANARIRHGYPVDELNPSTESDTIKKIPVITSKRKELNFYLGDKFDKRAKKSLVSSGWLNVKSKGDYFVIHPLANNDPFGEESFADYSLDPNILRILEKADIEKPTNIQQLAIPCVLGGSNSLLAAETGCGKTLAYLLPLIHQVSIWKKLFDNNEIYNSPYAFIIAPTKELAEQIGAEARSFSSGLGISVKTLTNKKGKDLLNHPPVDNVDILVGSFGLINRLVGVRIYKLNLVRHIILDEADALFHETFHRDVRSFLQRLNLNHKNDRGIVGGIHDDSVQLTLASATMPRRLSEVLSELVDVNSLPILATENLHRIKVPQKFLRIGPGQKPAELLKYMKSKLSAKEHVIIFTNENRTCDWVKIFLQSTSIDVICINGTMPLVQRRGIYKKFLSGEIKVLSTTNAGSRGLDTTMVKHVLNYDFPLDTTDYVHRCGRTGRLGSAQNCTVTSFITTRDVSLVRQIERSARENKPIPIAKTPEKDGDTNETEEDLDDHYRYLESIIKDSEQENNVPF